jgi:hypothetical protein
MQKMWINENMQHMTLERQNRYDLKRIGSFFLEGVGLGFELKALHLLKPHLLFILLLLFWRWGVS